MARMPKPYYRSYGITLYHGDCVELIPRLPVVDATVTSPPYNTLGKRIPKKGTGRMKGNAWIEKVNKIGYADSMPEDEYQAWLNQIIGLAMEQTRGLVWINHKIRYRDGVALHPARIFPFPIYSEIVWARAGSIALNCRRFAPSHEGVWGFGKPHWWDNAQNKLLSVWKISQVQNRTDHPCPYPKELPKRIIAACVPPGGTVLDPFAGSCTTAIAAVEIGRKAIAIDKSQEYLDSAIERIEAELPAKRERMAVAA